MVSLPIRRRILVSGGLAAGTLILLAACGATALAAMARGHTKTAIALWASATLAVCAAQIWSLWALAQPWHALPDVLGRITQQPPPARRGATRSLWQRIKQAGLPDDPVQLFAAQTTRAAARLQHLAPRLAVATDTLARLGEQAAQNHAGLAAAARQAEACLQRAHTPAPPAAIRTAPQRLSTGPGNSSNSGWDEATDALRQLATAIDTLVAPPGPPALPATQGAGPSDAQAAHLTETQVIARMCAAQAPILGRIGLAAGGWPRTLATMENALALAHAAKCAPRPPTVADIEAITAELQGGLQDGCCGTATLRDAIWAAARACRALTERTGALAAGAQHAQQAPAFLGVVSGPGRQQLAHSLQRLTQSLASLRRGQAAAQAPRHGADRTIRQLPAAAHQEIQQAQSLVAQLIATTARLGAHQAHLDEALTALGELRCDLDSIAHARPAAVATRGRIAQARQHRGPPPSHRLPPTGEPTSARAPRAGSSAAPASPL